MKTVKIKHKGMYALAVIFLLIVVYGFWPKPVYVVVEKVATGTIRVSINEEGKTRVIDRFVLSAPVSAYARRIPFKVGDSLKKGDVVVELEPLRPAVLDARTRAEAKAKVSAAEAVLHSARAKASAADSEMQLAQKEFKRINPLYRKKLVSRREFDVAESSLRRAKANKRSADFAVEVAKHEWKAAQMTLKHTAAEPAPDAKQTVKVRAPVKGSVLKMHIKSEGVVKDGQALVEIGDPAALEVEVDVLSSDAVRIQSGTRVLFKRWGGTDELEGVVRTVEPVGFTKVSALGVEEQRVLVIIDITSDRDKWKKLGDGYRVEAEFILWQGFSRLRIPSTAVFRKEGSWHVYKVVDKKARLQAIEVGKQGGYFIEVTRGLKQNDIIIAHPDDQIQEDTRVKWRK